MNRVVITGNLVADPETRTTNSGKTVTNFTVAVTRRGGEEKTTLFFHVAAWQKLSDLCGRYLSKGKKVLVIGEVSARAYIDKEDFPKAVLEIYATEVEFLSSRPSSDVPDVPRESAYSGMGPAEAGTRLSRAYAQGAFEQITDFDMPF